METTQQQESRQASNIPGRSNDTEEDRESPEVPLLRKPHLRNYQDVVICILQDDKIPMKDFSVGYLDRFRGIVEEDFCDLLRDKDTRLAWLAPPDHRVLYFKYKELIVWDRCERLDLMFRGSQRTPVGMYNIITNYDDIIRKERTEERTESMIMEAVAGASAAEEKPSRKRPTHFICWRLSESSILNKLADIQGEILKTEPALADYMVAPTSAHVTLLVMRLEDTQDLQRVKLVLKSCQKDLQEMVKGLPPLKFEGTGRFFSSVFYGMMSHQKDLADIEGYIESKLKDEGINLGGNRKPYSPHLTVLKGAQEFERESGWNILPELQRKFRRFFFGSQEMDVFYLCPMEEEKEDGFYQILDHIVLK